MVFSVKSNLPRISLLLLLLLFVANYCNIHYTYLQCLQCTQHQILNLAWVFQRLFDSPSARCEVVSVQFQRMSLQKTQ